MRLMVDGLPVLFPYDYIYPEQYQYMRELKSALDASGHGLLEMPSGTGKTATILSLLLSYQQQERAPEPRSQSTRKIIYSTRTVPEIDKALAELKRIVEYREKELGRLSGFLGLGLSSRKNLCINERVLRMAGGGYGRAVDAACHSLTASWMRAKAQDPEHDLCQYYENIESLVQDQGNDSILLDGVYTLDDLKAYGRAQKKCPYFLARQALRTANVIIYSYYYLLDPKVADLVSRELPRDAIVIFDEAHNIDNVCIESLSIDLHRQHVDSASRTLSRLSQRLEDIKEADAEKLRREYEALIAGLKTRQQDRLTDRIMASPVLPDDLLSQSTDPDESLVPGSIRKAVHFVAFLRRFVEFLRVRFRKCLHVVSESPAAFLQTLKDQTFIERRPLRFSSERLASLVKTLELADSPGIQNGNQDSVELAAVGRIAAFATIVSTYMTGFTVLFEPFDETSSTQGQAVLSLACLDATIAMRPVLSRFRSVIITSGTLSPLDMYPRLLDFTPVVAMSLPMTLVRDTFSPLIVTRGSDQVAVSSRFEIRNDPAVVRNYGQLLLDFARVVPDGIVAFFPSYTYLESIVVMWQEMGIIEQLLKIRLLFIETPDGTETAIALDNYRRACDLSQGPLLLSVARGKVSEGIDFDRHYGRCVLLFGIPYQYTESRILKARLEYMRDAYGIKETDWLTFDALRHAAQCLGRVLRGKSDYGLMVLADKRYGRAEKRSRLPRWIGQAVQPAHCNLSADQAVAIAKRFFRAMAIPIDMRDQLGFALLREADVERLEASLNTGHVSNAGYMAG